MHSPICKYCVLYMCSSIYFLFLHLRIYLYTKNTKTKKYKIIRVRLTYIHLSTYIHICIFLIYILFTLKNLFSVFLWELLNNIILYSILFSRTHMYSFCPLSSCSSCILQWIHLKLLCILIGSDKKRRCFTCWLLMYVLYEYLIFALLCNTFWQVVVVFLF